MHSSVDLQPAIDFVTTSADAQAGLVRVINLADLLIKIGVPMRNSEQLLSAPGSSTAIQHAGTNAVTARNIAFHIMDFAEQGGWTCDRKRWTVYLDDAHTGLQLLDVFQVINVLSELAGMQL